MLKALFTSLPACVALFWLAMIIFDFKRCKARRPLMAFMSATALLYLCHCAFFNEETVLYGYLDPLYVLVNLSVYPLYLYYLRAVAGDGNDKCHSSEIRGFFYLKKYSLLLPAIVMSVSITILYLLMTSAERNLFIYCFLFDGNSCFFDNSTDIVIKLQIILHKSVPLIFAAEVIYVFFAGMKSIRTFNRKIADYYTNSDNRNLLNIQWVMICFIIISFFSTTANLIGKEFFIHSADQIAIPSLIFGTMIFLVGYASYKQQFDIEEFEKELLNNDTTLAGKKKQPESRLSREQIDNIIVSKQLFLRKDLNITDVALELGTNRTYISKAINREFNTNFSNLINSYRIDCAKAILSTKDGTPDNKLIDDAICNTGFASESTFYRIFKETTGYSPKAWINQQK